MKPLARKTRRKLFWGLLIVFIILIPFVLAKSAGYKIGRLGDIFSLIHTGGIYLRSDVVNAQIYLNDEYVESSGVLIRNTFIQDLIPGRSYTVLVKKDGLHDWKKTLKIYPSIVNEARILMLPKEITKTAIFPFVDSTGIGTTTPSATTSTSTTSTKKPTPTNTNYIDLMELFAPPTATSTVDAADSPPKVSSGATSTATSSATGTATTSEEIPAYFSKLGVTDPDKLNNLITLDGQVLWLSDGDVVINWVEENSIPPYYYCLELTDCRSQIILDWKDDIKAFDFLPGRDDVLIVLVRDGIYAVEIDDRSDRNIQPIYLGQNLQFKKNGRDQIVVLDQETFYILGL